MRFHYLFMQSSEITWFSPSQTHICGSIGKCFIKLPPFLNAMPFQFQSFVSLSHTYTHTLINMHAHIQSTRQRLSFPCEMNKESKDIWSLGIFFASFSRFYHNIYCSFYVLTNEHLKRRNLNRLICSQSMRHIQFSFIKIQSENVANLIWCGFWHEASEMFLPFSISLQYSFRTHFERHLVVSIFFPIANLIMKALSFRSISFAYANTNKQE